MSKLYQYNVLIIGAGQIGAFYDQPGSIDFLSHAHAFSKHPGFCLIGFVDTDIKKAEESARLWGGQAFTNINEAFEGNKIDVVVNATPDEYHFVTLLGLLEKNIRLIFTEKPLTTTLVEAEKIKELAERKNIPIAVNYRRRFVPEFLKLKEDIDSNKFGEYVTGTGYYGKGLLHNGSHLLDLLRFLIGEVDLQQKLESQYDFVQDDPSISAILTVCLDRPFFMQCVDHRFYSLFELDMLFTKARVRILNSGFKIETQGIKNDTRFAGFKNMEFLQVNETRLAKSQYYATDNIYAYLEKGEDLKCSLSDGYQALKIALEIKNSSNKK